MAEPDAVTPPPDFERYAETAATMLGLPVDPAWSETVVANLRVLRACADLVEGFALPDEAEAAPVYEA